MDKFVKDILEFKETVQIDTENLVCGGHSFGGMTAIEVAHTDERVKAVYGLDPWLWCIYEDVLNKSFFLN